MENATKQSIETRREALYGSYDLPPEARTKAEAVFARMEALADEHGGDPARFEAALAAHPLTAEYNALFTEFAPYVKSPGGGTARQAVRDNTRRSVREGAKSVARHAVGQEVRSAVYGAMPDELRRWKFGGAIYSVPILGDILNAMNRMHFVKQIFGKFRKHKPKPAEAAQPDGNGNSNQSKTK
jgi:plasmid stabilization system protein ParE